MSDIQYSEPGITVTTYHRSVSYYRVTEEEISSLMRTSLEFQVFVALTTMSAGAFITSIFSEKSTNIEELIFGLSIILTIIFGGFSLYFYKKMKKEKKECLTNFNKQELDPNISSGSTAEELDQAIHDLAAHIDTLEASLKEKEQE